MLKRVKRLFYIFRYVSILFDIHLYMFVSRICECVHRYFRGLKQKLNKTKKINRELRVKKTNINKHWIKQHLRIARNNNNSTFLSQFFISVFALSVQFLAALLNYSTTQDPSIFIIIYLSVLIFSQRRSESFLAFALPLLPTHSSLRNPSHAETERRAHFMMYPFVYTGRDRVFT